MITFTNTGVALSLPYLGFALKARILLVLWGHFSQFYNIYILLSEEKLLQNTSGSTIEHLIWRPDFFPKLAGAFGITQWGFGHFLWLPTGSQGGTLALRSQSGDLHSDCPCFLLSVVESETSQLFSLSFLLKL